MVPSGTLRGTTMATITVFLADDNGDMLTDLRDELAGQFIISGTAANGQDALRDVLRCDPDILVLDITMPLLNGLQVAEQLRALKCRAKILFLTIHEEPEYISAAFSVGACGYVSKRHLASDLIRGIREVFDGRKFLSPILQK